MAEGVEVDLVAPGLDAEGAGEAEEVGRRGLPGELDGELRRRIVLGEEEHLFGDGQRARGIEAEAEPGRDLRGRESLLRGERVAEVELAARSTREAHAGARPLALDGRRELAFVVADDELRERGAGERRDHPALCVEAAPAEVDDQRRATLEAEREADHEAGGPIPGVAGRRRRGAGRRRGHWRRRGGRGRRPTRRRRGEEERGAEEHEAARRASAT